MWDKWEDNFDCQNSGTALLPGFRRDFNKSSIRNWGTEQSPCPTLGLTPDNRGECVGIAFEFPDERRDGVLTYLAGREGRAFSLQEREIRLDSERVVAATTPINDTTAATFIGDRSLADRANLVRAAIGTKGTCLEYVSDLDRKLAELGVEDPAVATFWSEVAKVD